MPTSSPINFTIGASTLTIQPSGIQEIYQDVVQHVTLSGKRIIVEPSVGPVVEVQWGVNAARAGVIAELRNARSSNGSVSISYVDASGTVVSRTVYMPQVNYDQFLLTSAIQPLTVQFFSLT